MELLGDALALALLGGERALDALAPLALDPVEHAVERLGQLDDLALVAIDRHAVVGAERIEALHRLDQPAERSEGAADDDEREELAELRQSARDTLNQVREVARRLRPEVLDDLGLGKAISALCERLGGQSGIAIGCDIDADLPQLAPEAELVTYRVAQEALTNTLRHSGAQRAAVTLEHDGEDVLLTVADDGRGLGESGAGAGIQGMRERALLIGARFRIDPGDEAGTVVRLRLDGRPWTAHPPAYRDVPVRR